MRTERVFLPIVAAGLFGSLAAPAVAGPDWSEVGDAGSFLGTAQVPFGGSPTFTNILGSLSPSFRTPDYEDMYFIHVADPSSFSMQISSSGFNAQLFIFNVTLPLGAFGLLANDDRSAGDQRPLVLPMSTDGPGPIELDLPGDYLVGVSGFGRNPVSLTGLIFNMVTNTEISRADGPGGLNRHSGWTGEGETGSYNIEMTGVTFPEVPAPGAVALLALAALPRRRRAGSR